MTRVCPSCGSSEIDEDSARGDSTCMSCGTVLEESAIVSELQFQERGGGHQIVGQFVGRDRGQPTSLSGVPGLSRNESRESTFLKGHKIIQRFASQLRINSHCDEVAFNFYKMCVSRNLTRGRDRNQVVVACMYMACRTEHTSHLLLDFSDVTQINVFDLGKTLTFLARSLSIKLPTTDPCLYILRFAAMLDFGDKQKQRMKRDWISEGRRPTGLCGAALLLAARAFNVNRTVSDVVRVVHISESVVRKRLGEFANTPSGSLTIDEFTNVDLEEYEDPPAFQESLRRYRELQKHREEEEERKRREEEEKLESVTRDIGPVREQVEEALRRRFKRSPYAKLITNPNYGTDEEDCPELRDAECHLREELIETVYQVAERDNDFEMHRREKYGPTLASLGIVSSDSQVPCTSSSSLSTDSFIHDGEGGPAVNDDGTEIVLGRNCVPNLPDCIYSQQQQRPSLSHGVISDNSINNSHNTDELDLTGIDDDEIDGYILNEVEVTVKTRMWLVGNAEHLAAMERRRKLREEEEERTEKEGGGGTISKKRRKTATTPRAKRGPITAASHNEAIYQVIQEKSLSNKINYDILRKMEEGEEAFEKINVESSDKKKC